MRKIYIFALFFSIVLNIFAEDREVTKSLSVSRGDSIKIVVIAGSISINSWSSDTIWVSGRIEENVADIVVKRDNGVILLKEVLRNKLFKPKTRVDCRLQINIPYGVHVNVMTTSADTKIAGLTGSITYQTVSGDLNADCDPDSFELQTIDGNIIIEGSTGVITGTSMSGNISISGNHPIVKLKSVSGDIGYDVESVESLSIYSTSGNMEIFSKSYDRAHIEIDCVSGDVFLNMMGNENIHLSINSISGRISFDDKNFNRVINGKNSVNLKRGERGSTVFIETLSGNVTVVD